MALLGYCFVIQIKYSQNYDLLFLRKCFSDFFCLLLANNLNISNRESIVSAVSEFGKQRNTCLLKYFLCLNISFNRYL